MPISPISSFIYPNSTTSLPPYLIILRTHFSALYSMSPMIKKLPFPWEGFLFLPRKTFAEACVNVHSISFGISLFLKNSEKHFYVFYFVKISLPIRGCSYVGAFGSTRNSFVFVKISSSVFSTSALRKLAISSALPTFFEPLSMLSIPNFLPHSKWPRRIIALLSHIKEDNSRNPSTDPGHWIKWKIGR